MRAVPRILYFVCFLGLALVGALAFNGVVEPSMATTLTRAVFVAAACAAPGLIHRRLWPLAVVLVPIGCYLLLRTITPLPILVEGAAGQYHFYTDHLYQGWLEYKSAFFPLPVSESPSLQLLLAFTVFWVVALAGFVSLSLRRPLPGVAAMLALTGYGLTVDTVDRVLWPALLFVVLAACLLVMSRGIKRSGWRMREAVTGGAVGIVAAALALVLLVAAPSVVAQPWKDWRAWDPFGQSRSLYTFNWLQNYPELLDPANNSVVMRVESPSPSYWRANALDEFNGDAWVTSQVFVRRILADHSGDSYVYAVPAADPSPPGKQITEVFSVDSVATYYLFTGGDPRSLTAGQSVALYMNDVRSLRVTTALGPSFRYSVDAVIPDLAPAELVGLGSDYPEALDAYLGLPFTKATDLTGPDPEATWRTAISERAGRADWLELYALNRRIIGDATDPYHITLRIERYLRQFYSYSLDPPASDYSSPYAAFLFDTRSGYCQHFAGSMALLLRYNGIPSRVAVGFATGERESEGVYLVTRNNAHAWVEAYFPTVGWVAFDPTPGRSLPTAGASSTSPGFVNPFVDTSPVGPGTVVTAPPRDNLPETGVEPEQSGSGGAESWLSRAHWLPWVAAVVVLLASWPAVRGLWRHRKLHRGDWGQRLQASLGLLRTELADYGAPVSPAQTLEELLEAVKRHVGLETDRTLVDRADAVLFGGRRAAQADVERAETLRREVKARLRRRHGWLRTGMTWYGVSRISLRARA